MIKKKRGVFRLILKGSLLAQLQEVDKDIKNLSLLFLKAYVHVLHWIIIGQEWGSVLFFPIPYHMISDELVIIISGSKYKIKVMTMLKYLSHSKVEQLYPFKRHTSDFLRKAFWRNFGLTHSFRNKLGYFLLFPFVFSSGGVNFFFLIDLCTYPSLFSCCIICCFFPPCKQRYLLLFRIMHDRRKDETH